jgi:hypothetical protein
MVREVSVRNQKIRDLIDRGSFAEIYLPAFEAKELALAIDEHSGQLPPERRQDADAAIRQLVRSAWLLDAFGDIGNRQQIVDTYARFGSAVSTLESLFPDDPPRFHARIPHGYYSHETIERDLVGGGFKTPEFTTVTKQSHTMSPRTAAMAYCQGTPLRNEIEARDPSFLSDATVASNAIAERFGTRSITGKTQAHVVMVKK